MADVGSGGTRPAPHAAARASGGPADQLASVVALRDELVRAENDAVEVAVAAGWRWREIADALGVSAQAVHKKHAARLRERGVYQGRRT